MILQNQRCSRFLQNRKHSETNRSLNEAVSVGWSVRHTSQVLTERLSHLHFTSHLIWISAVTSSMEVTVSLDQSHGSHWEKSSVDELQVCCAESAQVFHTHQTSFPIRPCCLWAGGCLVLVLTCCPPAELKHLPSFLFSALLFLKRCQPSEVQRCSRDCSWLAESEDSWNVSLVLLEDVWVSVVFDAGCLGADPGLQTGTRVSDLSDRCDQSVTSSTLN